MDGLNNIGSKMMEPILITGCARSGTSMVAGVINICGAFGGNMSGPNKNNEKGMFENARIRNQLVKPYLRKIGVDPLGQYPLPDVNNLPIPRDWRLQVLQIMKEEGYTKGPWMYKGAKACLMWPVWHYAFPDAKWVIVRRKTSDIIRSCRKTAFMTAFTHPNKLRAVQATTIDEGWLWWVHQHEKRFVEMITEGLNCQVVWPERMVDGDYSQMKSVIEWLGLEWKGEEVVKFIEPKLWKARQMKKGG
jgi:hypothetical protein